MNPTIALEKVVGPGDRILALPEGGEIRIGSGLKVHGNDISSTKPGVLHQTNKGAYWIEGRQKRYIPAVDDRVIGVISDRQYETYVLDIGAPFTALLPQLSFEGATKRNRPNLKVGDVVYARVVSASRDMEPMLSCVDSAGRSGGMGHLKEGLLINISTSQARALLASPRAPVLLALGESLQFEAAVGLNGRLWVSSGSPATTVIVTHAITTSEFLTPTQTQTLVARLLAQVQ